MTATTENDPTTTGREATGEPAAPVNSVLLRGRLSTEPTERTLPSGAVILTFRLVVTREGTPMAERSRQSSDWFDCTAWGGRPRRVAGGWRPGDVVEVEGALRRRFYRAGDTTATRLEVEVLGGRRLERPA